MGKFVKRQEPEAAESLYKIAKLNVSHAANHVTPSDIDIGFAAKATVDKALREKKVIQLQVLEFRKGCEVMLQITVSKIQERSPLKYNLARKLVSRDLRLMVSNPDNATKMFQQVLQILIENLNTNGRQLKKQTLCWLSTGSLFLMQKIITQQSFLLLRVEKIDWTLSCQKYYRCK